MSNKLTRIAQEVLNIESDLPYRLDYSKKPYPSIDDFDMYTFEQVWGDTTIGFSGVGGQVMTSARTYVFIPQIEEQCYVYFAGRFAYAVPYSQTLMTDIKAANMTSVAGKGKYCKIDDKLKKENK